MRYNHLRVPDHWEEYWTKYPEGYTILEALINWVSQVDSMVDNINDLNKAVEDFIQSYQADLTGTTVETLTKWKDDGTLEALMSEVFNNKLDTATFNSKMQKVDIELAKIPPLVTNDKVKREETWGTYDAAAVRSVIGNKAGADKTQVIGITLENDYKLAEYSERDTVAIYRSNAGRLPTLEINNPNYSVNGVTVPIGTDLSKVKTGMIIDTKHNPKYSGFIIGIQDNMLLINNWYQFGNTVKGQVPPNGAGMLVNPVTKVWTDNANVYLYPEHPADKATGNETGIINNKAAGLDTTGFDSVSMGSFGIQQHFRARSTTQANRAGVGFRDYNSANAFVSENDANTEGLLHNTKTGYKMTNDGTSNFFRLSTSNSGQRTSISPKSTPLFLITSNAVHTISAPANNAGCVVIVVNTTSADTLIEWPYWQPTQAGSLTIPARSVKFLICDGGNWYHS